MKKNSMTIAQLRIAGAVMFAFITNPNAGKGMTPEMLKEKVVAYANTEYKKQQMPTVPESNFAWKTITRSAINRCCALYPNTIVNVQDFCTSNPLVTGWLYKTSSTTPVNESECNYFTLHLMTAIHSRYVLTSTGAKSTKEETINYLNNELKTFFVGSNISLESTITDDVVMQIVSLSIGSIKLATPEILASYTKKPTDWKPFVVDCLTTLSKTVYSDWSIVASVPAY